MPMPKRARVKEPKPAPPSQMGRLLTVREAAKKLRYTEMGLYHAINKGRIQGFKVAHRLFVPEYVVNEHLRPIEVTAKKRGKK